jgi:lysophospholipase L1-like esterase
MRSPFQSVAVGLLFPLAAALPFSFWWKGAAILSSRLPEPPPALESFDGEALAALLLAADVVAASREAPAHRTLPPPKPRAVSLRALGEKLAANADPALLRNPCLAQVGPSCTATALDGFFDALDQQREEGSTRPAVISILGNSLIAGDRIIDVLREDLQELFGDGGRGMLLLDRMASYGGRSRTSAAADGWSAHTLADLERSPHPFGISGVHHVATAAGASARFDLQGEQQVSLWWIDRASPAAMTVRADGQVLAQTRPEGSGTARVLRVLLPEGARTLEVQAGAEGAVALGVTLEHARPGVVVDGLGVPSSDASLFLRVDEEALQAQFQARRPSLVVFMLGGNEVKRLEWKRSSPAQVDRDLDELVRRVRQAAPGASCMLVSPIDALVGGDGPDSEDPRPFLAHVTRIQADVAERNGCAFFDLHAAMGGDGSLLRFDRAGLMHEDRVHPKGQGLDLLGQLLTDALLNAWQATPRPDPAQLEPAWATLRAVPALPDATHADPLLRRADLRETLSLLGWVEPSGEVTDRGRRGQAVLAVARDEAARQ